MGSKLVSGSYVSFLTCGPMSKYGAFTSRVLPSGAARASLPSSTAAADLPSCSGDGTLSSIWPVAIRMTWTALPITSAGRRSPLGPLGIRVILKNGFNQPLKLALARTYTRPSEIGGYFDFFCAAICRSTATDLYMRPFMLDVESLVLGIER
jgi:hypothetical protein